MTTALPGTMVSAVATIYAVALLDTLGVSPVPGTGPVPKVQVSIGVLLPPRRHRWVHWQHHHRQKRHQHCCCHLQLRCRPANRWHCWRPQHWYHWHRRYRHRRNQHLWCCLLRHRFFGPQQPWHHKLWNTACRKTHGAMRGEQGPLLGLSSSSSPDEVVAGAVTAPALEDIRVLQQLLRHAAQNLGIQVEEVMEESNPDIDILAPSGPSHITLPLIRMISETTKTLWQTPTSLVPTAKRNERWYFVLFKGYKHLYTHPPPDSLMVDVANKRECQGFRGPPLKTWRQWWKRENWSPELPGRRHWMQQMQPHVVWQWGL
ncbi:hypothetical protein UY3_06532 [Chelonia mydas]|uniref:Uncharacterized protein n=1 Tax=Chelonia mydas TaxID=8469 RepID=M7C6Z7_CHEMY|nr:hypothetical protein UY3_06532 [Chelonia mydas]